MTDVNSHEAGLAYPKFLSDVQKFIRVRSPKEAKFVEFDFAIGDPSLFVELVLPQHAFEQFCITHEVIHMTDEQMQRVDAEMEKWRYGEDTLMQANKDT